MFHGEKTELRGSMGLSVTASDTLRALTGEDHSNYSRKCKQSTNHTVWGGKTTDLPGKISVNLSKILHTSQATKRSTTVARMQRNASSLELFPTKNDPELPPPSLSKQHSRHCMALHGQPRRGQFISLRWSAVIFIILRPWQ